MKEGDTIKFQYGNSIAWGRIQNDKKITGEDTCFPIVEGQKNYCVLIVRTEPHSIAGVYTMVKSKSIII